jgi:hypothetical protein
MQFKAFEPGVEVFGANVGAFVDAFKLFPSVMLKTLARNGIGTLTDKNQVEVDREKWYPQEKWLAAWEEVARDVGARACYQIGRHVPRHAAFPPTVKDIHSAIGSIDIAYHMNHRKNGRVMFDPATGTKLSGIGTYGYKPVTGERRIISVCENPYPCDFDRGLLSEIASKFEKQSRVTHDDAAPCRTRGAQSCTYVVSW